MSFYIVLKVFLMVDSSVFMDNQIFQLSYESALMGHLLTGRLTFHFSSFVTISSLHGTVE